MNKPKLHRHWVKTMTHDALICKCGWFRKIVQLDGNHQAVSRWLPPAQLKLKL